MSICVSYVKKISGKCVLKVAFNVFPLSRDENMIYSEWSQRKQWHLMIVFKGG